MKISIVGTRGIPNNYGGFEQFAQYLSIELTKYGYDVWVYTPSYRKEKIDKWKGVHLKKIFCPSIFNGFSQILYDYLSLKNALKEKSDVVLVCGYVSSYLALLRYKKYKTKIVVHMDGWEWKRKKWNLFVRSMIRYTEKQVVKNMHFLVVDHPILKKYYLEKYKKDVFEIAYGCHLNDIVFLNENIDKPFFLVIARNEKENNIELVCQSFIESGIEAYLYIFTNKRVACKSDKIRCLENEYDENVLNYYRNKALAYIHAYTVGGTNPSLLESMAYCNTIIALDNDFHHFILEENALYFKTKDELTRLFRMLIFNKNVPLHREANRLIIQTNYQWSLVAEKYLELFNKMKNEQNFV
ncbi:MAG TPA: DUF1972 domain-containing protein [Bacteroidales bacterium]|nr:DUF1972 domain-containing protein [Bacteroidales bacterium]